MDRIDGVGTGRYNGETGYTVEFTLIDAGEPGTSDSIGFRVFDTTTGVTVLTLPLQNIVDGNVQARDDRPHKWQVVGASAEGAAVYRRRISNIV